MGLYLKELLGLAEKQLAEAGVLDAARDSRTLYCHLMGIDSARLVLEYPNFIQDEVCDKYFELIEQRASGLPIQYMLGEQEFMGITFKVDPRVLIPRQDTESLVENAISLLTDGTLLGETVGKPGRAKDVLDLCTGSGCVGISLAKLYGSGAPINITCSDISADALAVAKENARLNGVARQIDFAQGDLFAPFRKKFKSRKFDLIVGNPPYIETDVIPTLQREIAEHEPIAALDGGADGLDFYRRIVAEAPDFLNPAGVLLLEIGCEQGAALKSLIQQSGRYKEGGRLPDLTGRDRMIYARVD